MEMNVSDSDNGSSFPSLEVSTCSGADDLQLDWYLNFAWWLEGFLQLVTGKGKKFRIVKLIFVTRGIFNQTPGKNRLLFGVCILPKNFCRNNNLPKEVFFYVSVV
jgi:hypothetical protein